MYKLVLNDVNDVIPICTYEVVLYKIVWDQKKRKPVSSKDMMGIVQQQSVQGELDETWKIMRAEWRDNKELIGEQGLSDFYLLLPELEVWKLFEVTHCHMWQTEQQNTRWQKQQKWPVMNLAAYRNSYRNQIISEKITSLKKMDSSLLPRYLGIRSIMYRTTLRYCLNPKLITYEDHP